MPQVIAADSQGGHDHDHGDADVEAEGELSDFTFCFWWKYQMIILIMTMMMMKMMIKDNYPDGVESADDQVENVDSDYGDLSLW